MKKLFWKSCMALLLAVIMIMGMATTSMAATLPLPSNLNVYTITCGSGYIWSGDIEEARHAVGGDIILLNSPIERVTVWRRGGEYSWSNAGGDISSKNSPFLCPIPKRYKVKSIEQDENNASWIIITITPIEIVTGVTLYYKSTTLEVGGIKWIYAIVERTETDKSVTYESSNPDVATVDDNGKVTAVAAGTATITVKTTDEVYSATCIVTVTDGETSESETTPSKSEEAAPPTIPTDYVAERVAEEEAMVISPVSIDANQFGEEAASVVPSTSYNLSNLITTKGIVKGINTAVTAANEESKDTVEIYSSKPFCFNGEILKSIQDGKKTVVYYFVHKGNVYSVTIPATVDAEKVLEKAGFAGPLYIGQQLGTTKLVK